jgi:hypothetical protein
VPSPPALPPVASLTVATVPVLPGLDVALAAPAVAGDAISHVPDVAAAIPRGVLDALARGSSEATQPAMPALVRAAAAADARPTTASSTPDATAAHAAPPTPKSPAKPPAPAPKPHLSDLLPYDLRSHPEKVAALLASSFTLLQLVGSGRGLATAAAGGRRSGGAKAGGAAGGEGDGDDGGGGGSAYEGLEIEQLGAGMAALKLGDRSRTWKWPGTRPIDRVSSGLPMRLARRSPLASSPTARTCARCSARRRCWHSSRAPCSACAPSRAPAGMPCRPLPA